MLAGSIALIAVSAVALVLGWLNANESYIWSSIGATAASFVLLVLAFVRSRRAQPAAALSGTVKSPPPAEAAASETATTQLPDEGDHTAVLAPSTPGDAPPDAEPSPVAPAPEDGTDATASPAPATEIVVVPKTKKFHRSDCRFASAKGAEPTTRADAEERGFEPCGVCKP